MASAKICSVLGLDESTFKNLFGLDLDVVDGLRKSNWTCGCCGLELLFVLLGTIGYTIGSQLVSPQSTTMPRRGKGNEEKVETGIDLRFVQNLDIAAVHSCTYYQVMNRSISLYHLLQCVVEMAHSSNLIIGSTFNSAQGDIHFNNRDSESGM